MSRFALVALLALSSATYAVVPENRQWEEVRNRRGIVVYRGASGEKGLYSAKALGVVAAPLRRVASVLLDVQRRKEWFPDLIEGHVIKQASPFERLEYMAVRTPFPLTNRDFVFRGTLSYRKESKTLTIGMNSVEVSDAPQTDLVRGNIVESSFVLEELVDGNTYVDYTALMDPRGHVPKWIVNLVQTNVPFNTIALLRRQVARDDVVELPEVADLIK